MAMQRQHSVVERIKILSVAPGEHYCRNNDSGREDA